MFRYLLVWLFGLSLAFGDSIVLKLDESSTSAVVGKQSTRIGFTNSGSLTDRYGTYFVNNTRKSWMYIRKIDNNYKTGYIEFVRPPSEGVFTVELKSCKNTSKNECSAIQKVTITVSKKIQPLQVSIGNFSIKETETLNKGFSISGGISPYLTKITGSFSNGDKPYAIQDTQRLTCLNDSSCQIPSVTSDKTFKFTLTVIDEKGQGKNKVSKNFTITISDKPKANAPSAPILYAPTVNNETGEVKLVWSESSNNPNRYEVTYSENSNSQTVRPTPITATNITLKNLKKGVEYTVFVKAHNTAGYSPSSITQKFIIGNSNGTNNPPTIRCSVPSFAKISDSVRVSYTTGDKDNDKVSSSIKFGDNQSYKSNSIIIGSYSTTHKYSKGAYQVTAKAFDSKGDSSSTVSCGTITITDGSTPILDSKGYLYGDPSSHAPATASVGYGVNAVTGNFYYEDMDAHLKGKEIEFGFVRNYNSMDSDKDSFGQALPRALGKNWSHNYNIVLRQKDNLAELILGDGSRYGFIKSGSSWGASTYGNSFKLTQSGSGYSVTSLGQIKYHFDTTGNLTAIESKNGHKLQFSYSSNRLTYIDDSVGNRISFSYNAQGYISTMSFPPSRTVSYEYTNDNRLKTVTDTRGNKWNYLYSTSNFKIYRANASFNATQNKVILSVDYDNQGRVESQESGFNLKTVGSGKHSFSWATNSMTYNSPSGAGAKYEWDSEQRITKITPINVPSTIVPNRFDYSQSGIYSLLPSYLQDNKGAKNQLSYSGFDINKIDAPLNQSTTMSYNSHHDLINYTTPQGLNSNISYSGVNPSNISISAGDIAPLQTALSYNSEGLPTKVEGSSSKVEVKSYHATGQPQKVEIKDKSGKVLQTSINSYDSVGRLISTLQQPQNSYSCFSYDANDNLLHGVSGISSCSGMSSVSATSSISHTAYEYDANNRVVKTISAYGSSEQQERLYSYSDDTGVLAKVCQQADGVKRCQSYRYDNDMRLFETTHETINNRKDRNHILQSGYVQIANINAEKSARKIIKKEFDANGNLKRVSSCINMENRTNPVSDCQGSTKRVEFEYDALNRATKIYTSLDSSNRRVVNIGYSSDGKIKTITYPEGNQEIFKSDSLGRLIEVTQSKNGKSLTSKYSYDSSGNLIKIIDPSNHITTFKYDALGRKIERNDLRGVERWSYDDANSRVTYTKPDGATIVYGYDKGGNIISVNGSDGYSATYNYDALSNLVKSTWSANGKSGSREYSYNEFGELLSVKSPFGKIINYSRDNAGRLTSRSYEGMSLNYSYDNLNHLKSMNTPVGLFKFWYDDFNDALLKTAYPNGIERVYQRNRAGDLIGLESSNILNYQIGLDRNGKRSTIQATQPQAVKFPNENLTFELDSKGLLSKINSNSVTYDGNGNILSLPAPFNKSFSYDIFDRTTSNSGTDSTYDDGRLKISKISNGVTTDYLWDKYSQFGNMVAEYQNSQLKAKYIYGPDGLLAQIDKDGKATFIHSDFNHNVVALTDSSKALKGSFAYTPYGKLVAQNGYSDLPFKFAGGVGVMSDGDSIYMRAREYHTGIRQFTTPDLIEGSLNRPQSLNRYAYVEGMALSGVDASGLFLDDFIQNINMDLKSKAFDDILKKGLIFSNKHILTQIKNIKLNTIMKTGVARKIRVSIISPIIKGLRNSGTYNKVLNSSVTAMGIVGSGVFGYFIHDDELTNNEGGISGLIGGVGSLVGGLAAGATVISTGLIGGGAALIYTDYRKMKKVSRLQNKGIEASLKTDQWKHIYKLVQKGYTKEEAFKVINGMWTREDYEVYQNRINGIGTFPIELQ